MLEPINFHSSLHSRQRGVVLVIALIVLVAMTLVAIGTLRSVDTSNVVAGNLGFKQATLNGADQAVEAGYRYLANNLATTANLVNDNVPSGYLASVPATEPNWTDSTDNVWTNAVCMNNCAADANGNRLYYVIHRMCSLSGVAYNGSVAGVANQCHMTLPTGGSTTGGSMRVGADTYQGNPQLYYRITAKVTGPRNSVSIVQAVVAI
jgi:type IV pilus assembly protein PilX